MKNIIKSAVTVAFTTIFSFLGILATPIFLLLGCNIIDYITGLAAAASITSASANVKILSDVVFNNSKNLVVEVTGNIGDEFVINTSLTNGSYCGVAILG